MNHLRLTPLKAAVWLVVLTAASFLFMKAESLAGVDPVKHNRILSHLSELERLNADVNEIVLRLPHDQFNNFDPLVATLDQIKMHHRALESGAEAIAGRSEDIDQRLAALADGIEVRERLAERFTSYSAILRNSVYYIPLSIDVASRNPATPVDLRERLNLLLYNLFQFQVLGANEARDRISASVEVLHNDLDTYPCALRGDLSLVVRHAQNMLEYRERVDALTGQITTGGSWLLSHELSGAYSRWFGRQLRYANVYRLVLLLTALILLTYGVHTFLRLRDTAARLNTSETKYRSMVASLAEGVLIRNREGRVVECNASAARILCQPVERIRGSTGADPSWQSTREDGTPLPDEEWPSAVVLRTGQPQFDVVVGIRRETGPPLWISVNAQPVTWRSDNASGGAIVSFRDITAQKQAEEALDFLAHHDSLTGLPNRLLFIDRIGTAVCRARRNGTTARSSSSISTTSRLSTIRLATASAIKCCSR